MMEGALGGRFSMWLLDVVAIFQFEKKWTLHNIRMSHPKKEFN